MLKRCLSPLTLVNQLALIVLLSTAIGVTGMAISGWLVQGVQGNAHAINEAGSLRMQSYRLLASVPLTQADQPLIDEMERTAFSPELERAAIRDGQQSQLKALQAYPAGARVKAGGRPGNGRPGCRRVCFTHRSSRLLVRSHHRVTH